MSEIEPTHLAAVLHNNKNVFAQLLVSYFEENFTGSHFEFWDDQAGIQNNENKITSADVYSTSFLGVDVPPRAGMSFVNGPDSKLISELLSKLPLNTALDEYSNFPLDKGSIADQLWTALKKKGMGPTRISKLMARKRPKLIPILDSVTQDALGLSNNDRWKHVYILMRDAVVHKELMAIQELACQLSPKIFKLKDLSLIRVLDICVWMEHRKYNLRPTEKVPKPPKHDCLF